MIGAEQQRSSLIGCTPSVPAADLGRLAACVTEEVLVSGVRGGLGPLLGSLRCRLIVIKNVSLTPAETRSLVTAMTTCLKTVFLGRYDRDRAL